jgi:hypothetical protein
MPRCKNPSKKELEIAQKDANKRVHEMRKKIDITLPMTILVKIINGLKSQVYGLLIQRKIIYDSMEKLFAGGKDEADSYLYNPTIGKKIFYEIKSSYSSEKGTYRVTHIRDYQEDFDYFLICLIDQDNDCNERFYVLPKSFILNNFKVIPMNGTKKANQDNKNIDKAMTIRKEVAYKVFGENNLLKNTSYSAWLKYLNETVSLPKEVKGIRNAVVNPIQNAYTSCTFKVNGRIIRGKNNEDTIIMLADYIGGFAAMSCFPKNKISVVPTKTCRIKLRTGNYYINPKLEIYEMLYIIDKSKSHHLKIDLV